VGVLANLFKDYNHNDLVDSELEQIQPIDDKIMNIALFGIDSRDSSGKDSFKGLSDSIMVLSVNTKTGDIKLISVMRDSFVKVPGYKNPQKINAAYSLGGPVLAIKTLNENFGLDIKEYATVNFFGMAEIIDAVGGVEIEVLSRELKNLNQSVQEQADRMGIDGKSHYVTQAGVQNLTGIQAVSWARIRKVSTADGVNDDYGRTDRQRVVMEKLLNKALETDVGKYPGLIKAILPHMETSLGFSEILSLATHVLGKQVNFQQTRIPQNNYVINGGLYISYAGSVVYYDLDYAKKIIHAIIYDGMTQDEYIKENGIEKKGWYSGAAAGNISSGSSQNSSTGSSSSQQISSDQTSSDDQTGSDDQNSSDQQVSSDDQTSSDDQNSQEEGTDEDAISDQSQTETSSDETSQEE
jgi:LCP family protein required for cell wall assembly